MKRIYSFSIILLLITFSSCKDFLETKPSDTLSPANYYETEDQLNLALTGVYDIMATAPLYGGEMLGRMGIEADEGYHARSAQITGVHVYDVSVSDPSTEAFYKTFYDGINRANVLLANIGKPKMDATKRGIIEGEALFLRAYYYFMLVQYFGDIPLRLTPPASAKEGAVERTPAKQVYEQIIADMTKAEGLVRTATEVGKPGHINKSTVRGILARVCLRMAGYPVMDVSKYQLARDWAKKVIDSKEHDLNPSYSQVFINMAQDKYDIKESIWEVEFWGNGTTSYVELSRVGSNNGIQYTDVSQDPTIGYSYGFLSTTERHFKLYDPNDLRRDWTIAPYRLSGNPAVKTAWKPTEIYNRNSGKWRREYEVVTPKAKNGGPQNFPLLRYSDVLLMFAEAENYVNNGPTADAINAVNLVRRRAAAKGVKTINVISGGANYTTAPTVTITGGGGTGAIGVANINTTTKTVTSITVFTSGDGYTSLPTVAISGGGGTGATAAATALYTVADADLSPAQTASKDAFLATIQDERSRELGFEGLRKQDLVRWGIFLDRMKLVSADFALPTVATAVKYGALSYKNASDRDVLWPIPVREMGLNKNWSQNFGW